MRSSTGAWPPLMDSLALPIAAALLLAVGGLAAATGGALGPDVVLGLCALVVLVGSATGDPATAIPLGLVGWMAANAFSAPPYGELRPTGHGAVTQAIAVAAAAVTGAVAAITRRLQRDPRGRITLEGVTSFSGLAAAVAPRRRGQAVLAAICLLPAATALLVGLRGHLSLDDDLLIYLIVVVGVAVIGGLWPAIAAAIAASLLLNWFFTEPIHTFTIAEPDNLLALSLFVVVAVTVSSVVHLAARRAEIADRNRAEAEALQQLARLVLDHDTPAAILGHLHDLWGVRLQLLERSGSAWVRVADSGGPAQPSDTERRIDIRPDLCLMVYGNLPREAGRVVEAAAGQCAAALDRDRLRTQAAQAEALAAGNRMRTALLAAVSHDLRTPLASLKASISSLRQDDVAWSEADEAALLETIEDSTDRLTELIANLLDMSRVQTGALQPFLRPAALEEIVPVALTGLPDANAIDLDIPEDLPLALTDPGLLERALANLVSNAVRHSPPDQPPRIAARHEGGRIAITIADCGPGVAEQDRERIFEPFQRLGDQSPGTGIGLGLAVARGFVESVGGTISAGATPGGGLTMSVTVPAATATAPAQLA